MNKNNPTEATPGQLLTFLELEISAQRRKRKGRAHSRPLLVAGSLLLILGGAISAFVVLHSMLGKVVGNEARAAADVADVRKF